jgi:alkylation response protein AidB-like acyl-CoA dehydrogenase
VTPELDKAQLQIQKAVRDFVKGEFKKDVIDELVAGGVFPQAIWKKAAALGFIGIHFPEAYAGGGLGVFENTLIAEELCRGDSSVGACLARAGYGAELLLRFGTEPQKKAWLPKVTEGSVLCGAALTEPGLGSDLARSQTTAAKAGDGWVVTGTKSFVVNAGPQAGCYLVLCRTDAGAAEPAHGLSTLLVEADRPGVQAVDAGRKLGWRLISIGEVCFDQVRVPLDHQVGLENRGGDQVAAFLSESCITAAAQALGVAQGAFERAFAYVKQREQFATRIIDFQVTRHKVAEMATKIEAARLLTYQAARSFDAQKGRGGGRLSAMAKLYAGRTAVEVCDEAIQLLGGYGYIQDYEVERFYRDAKMIELFDGARGAQKNAIAEDLMKRGLR